MQALNHLEARQYSHLEMLAMQVVEGFITGLHKSPFHGFSVEFAEHRIYNAGESTRHIDWKLFGRTDKLFVKRFEEETNLRCQIVIDNSASMHYPQEANSLSKLTFSIQAAASLIYLLKTQRDASGLSVFSDRTELHTQAKSSSVHQKLLFYELEKLLAASSTAVKGKTHATAALHEIAEKTHKRSLIVIFSDMFDNSPNETNDMFSALQHLKHNKHEVILFHVVDKKHEMDFDFENRPYVFVDIETGEKVKAHANEVRDSYLLAMQSFEKELRLRCAQYQIDFVEADIAKGYNQILSNYLIKRQKMR